MLQKFNWKYCRSVGAIFGVVLLQFDGDGAYSSILFKGKYPFRATVENRLLFECDLESADFGDGRLTNVIESLPNPLDKNADSQFTGDTPHVTVRAVLSFPAFPEL